MQDHLKKLLEASLARQSQQYQKHSEPQTRSRGSFFLKVNGKQLQTASTQQRKRSRDTGTTFDLVAGEDGSSDWATAVLAALEDCFTNYENRRGSSGIGNNSVGDASVTASSTASALASLTGIELRHCQLQAQHIHTTEEYRPCLTHCLLSPTRLWRGHSLNNSCVSLCTSITTLDLECNLLGDEGVKQLCTHLLSSLPHLQRLLLASNRIYTTGFLHLLRFFTSTRISNAQLQLETLGLTNNAVGFCGSASKAEQERAKEDEMLDLWAKTVEAFVRDTSPTLRRIHLNHAALSTREAAAFIAAVFQYTYKKKDTGVFDLIYLRENKGVVKEKVLELLEAAASDRTALRSFIERHVSW